MSLVRQIRICALPRTIGDTICALAAAAEELSKKLKADDLWEFRLEDKTNTSGDEQTEQDFYSHQLFERALRKCPDVENMVSEEADGLVDLGKGNLSVSIDPFDGSKAYEFGIPPGTIFAIFEKGAFPSQFTGSHVIAAGVFVYRHSLELIFAVDGKAYRATANRIEEISELAPKRSLVCANLSNISKWSEGWSDYFSKRILEQKTKNKHNMRWYGSLAAHFGAIVRTGGIFAYPPDNRIGYSDGHLRLIYEAIPISFLIETLKGGATNGTDRILEIVPTSFHQKTPFVFGEASMVSDLRASIQTAEGSK